MPYSKTALRQLLGAIFKLPKWLQFVFVRV